MNERIRELAEQAKKYALDAMIKITDKEQALKVYSETYDTKFAELIVKKCANIVWDEAEKTMSSEVNDAGYKIIEYFGVAESEE